MRKLEIEERRHLEILVKETKDFNERMRICVILAYDKGHCPEDIADILRISRSSVYGYLVDYEKSGKISNDPHEGKPCKLNQEQEEELKAYLAEVTYRSAKEICAYVKEKYGIEYTVEGMTNWLRRNDFVYKKPKQIPGKIDPEKQEAFIKKYEELKDALKPGEQILFMDAVHPEYQSQLAYGWILKGKTKTLGTTTKQERVHFVGAIELKNLNIIAKEYETVNSSHMIDFLKNLEDNVEATKIHVICDNGRANRNREVQAYVQKSTKLEIHYLPPYSPNLNPIERLWKVLHEEVTYNKVYRKFGDFAKAVRIFFSEGVSQLNQLLRRRINDNFQRIYPSPVQTSI